MASSSSVDKSRFGTGYLTDVEKSGAFIFTSDHIRFDDERGSTSGGATPIHGYKGPWPIFKQSKNHYPAFEDDAEVVSEIVPASARKHPPRMICKSTGRCSACPDNERNRPYCQPYGNRAPIECRPVTVLEALEKPPPSTPSILNPSIDTSKSKQNSNVIRHTSEMEDQIYRLLPRQDESVISSTVYKGYQTCGKDQIQEAWDYSEFIGINLLLALAGLLLLVKRQRILAGQHQAMLARRIGRI